MKTTLFILSIFLTFTNACNQNQNPPSNKADNKTVEKTELLNNSDSIQKNLDPQEIITETQIEQIKPESKNSFFTLLSATSQSWTSGIPSGGSGTEYFFKIKITTTEKTTFETAWINNKAFEIFISKETGSISNVPIKYGNGDTIILRVSDLKNSNANSVNTEQPIKYDGAALIGYSVKGRNEYFTIKEIKKQSSPNRQ